MKIAAIATISLASPTVAEVLDIRGEWCAPERNGGGVLVIDDSGMGNQEHVVCDWQSPLVEDRINALEQNANCRSVYFHGEDVIENDLGPFRLSARLVSPNVLWAEIDAIYAVQKTPATIFNRCSM